MPRIPTALLFVLGLSLLGELRAQCACSQPSGSPAQVVACPCPDATCVRMFGTGEIGTWLRYETSTPGGEPGVFLLGLPTTSPTVIDPEIAICNDLKTPPSLFLGEICIAAPITKRDFYIFIPFDPGLVGLEIVTQHFWQRAGDARGMPPFMSSLVLRFTIQDRT